MQETQKIQKISLQSTIHTKNVGKAFLLIPWSIFSVIIIGTLTFHQSCVIWVYIKWQKNTDQSQQSSQDTSNPALFLVWEKLIISQHREKANSIPFMGQNVQIFSSCSSWNSLNKKSNYKFKLSYNMLSLPLSLGR